MKNITMNQMSNTLQETEGKQILINTLIGNFKMRSFGTLQSVDTYTDKVVIELDNNSMIELYGNQVNTIELNEEVSRSNTQTITVELDGQTITFEFEVSE